MFNFQWQDPKDMQTNQLLKEGEGMFKVKKIIETDDRGNPLISSKSGHPMVKIALVLKDSDGKTSYAFDYIVADQAWKIKSLCYACGMPELYDQSKNGIDLTKLLDKKGLCTIKTQKTPGYDDKSVLGRYIEVSTEEATPDMAKTIETVKSEFNDEIPF